MATPAQTRYRPLAEHRCSAAAEACIHPISRVTQNSSLCCLKYPAVPGHTAFALFLAGLPPAWAPSPRALFSQAVTGKAPGPVAPLLACLTQPHPQAALWPLEGGAGGCPQDPQDPGHSPQPLLAGRSMPALPATPRSTGCAHFLLGPRPLDSQQGQLKDSMSLGRWDSAPGQWSPTVSRQPNHGRGCIGQGDPGSPFLLPVTHHDMGF